MKVEDLLNALFPDGHEIRFEHPFFCGAGCTRNGDVSVIGTVEKAAIGVNLAMTIAAEVIRIIHDRPGSPILMLIDTSGQKMSRRDELLGLTSYIAHLAKTLEVARQRGHRLIGLVWGEAVSAGFLSSSLLADECYALPGAEVRVMNLPAMSRVTKIPLERLEELSKVSPVFAPGVENFVSMGAVKAVWEGDVAECLNDALAQAIAFGEDRRRQDGEERGGRIRARGVADRVRTYAT